MKILLLEDHSFFATELVDYFIEETNYEVCYAKSYKEAVLALDKHGPFDYTILDVILQNGKTGLDLVRGHKDKLGKIMFLTGCSDDTTLNTLQEYIVVSKLEVIWPKLEEFFKDELKPLKFSSSGAYLTQDV
jgi:DNA-binding response OmpR family regulator